MMRKGQNTWARPSPQPDIIYVATGATSAVAACNFFELHTLIFQQATQIMNNFY